MFYNAFMDVRKMLPREVDVPILSPMTYIGIIELARKLGWNRKRVYREAIKGNIPDTVQPVRLRGGCGAGFRFKDTSALQDWIKQNGDDAAALFHRLNRNIPKKDVLANWDVTLAAAVEFGKKAPGKLRAITTRYGFTNEMKNGLLKALVPFVTFYYELDRGIPGERTKEVRRGKSRWLSEF
jgi:hypothetical protein